MPAADSQQRRIYIGSHDGVCSVSSSDGGQTWERSRGATLAHAASRLTASATSGQRAYLAAYEAGVYRTDDGGNTWQHLDNYPSDYAHSVQVHPQDDQRVYVGSEPAAIFSSADGGQTWEECQGFQDVPESNQWRFHAEGRESHVRDLRIAPHDSSILWVGIEEGGIVRSGDGGKTWQQKLGLNDDIHCIGLSLANPQRVYVATARGPYRSDDEGGNWELINQGIEHRRYCLHIAAAPENADLVLLTASENSRRGDPQLYRSTNGGRDWQSVAAIGQDDDMVVGFDWDPHNPQRVYAGTDHGSVYVSEDCGVSWTQVPVNVGTIAVGALVAGA